MRRILLVSMAALLGVGPQASAQTTSRDAHGAAVQPKIMAAATAKPAPKPAFNSPEAVGRWMNTYRNKPDPQRLPELVRAMGDLGVFNDQDTAGTHLGFIGGVLAANPGLARELIDKMFPLAQEHHASIIKAIAYSGLPGWKQLLRNMAERTPSRVVLIDRLVTGKMPALDDLQLDAGPVPLDVLWGYYYATGRPEPVFRVISVLKWAGDANDVERLTVGSMVKWTLSTNASRDVELLRIIKTAMTFETKDVQSQLKDVILAAETGETQKVRKDALTAIEQLKSKGPAKTRNAQWWGQAGQMALSAGCIAASALGAGAAIGIPCVIGGAASSAALKLATPQ